MAANNSVSAEEESPSVAKFRQFLVLRALDARMKAGRSREYAAEWLVVGFALALLYCIGAIAPRQSLIFIDLVIVIVLGGGGLVMYVFEFKRGRHYEKLAAELLDEEVMR